MALGGGGKDDDGDESMKQDEGDGEEEEDLEKQLAKELASMKKPRKQQVFGMFFSFPSSPFPRASLPSILLDLFFYILRCNSFTQRIVRLIRHVASLSFSLHLVKLPRWQVVDEDRAILQWCSSRANRPSILSDSS